MFCPYLSLSLMIVSPALTAENLLSIVAGVEERWEEFAEWLFVPEAVKSKIEKDHSTSNDRLAAVFRYAIQVHPYASWRLVIRALDRVNDHNIADRIRKYAEPLTDDTLTVENTTSVVFKTEKDWNGDLGVALLIPESVRERIKEQHESINAQKRALMEYWIQTIYNASWPTLAGVLYYTEEETALVMCKTFLKNEQDDSLTMNALLVALKDVTDWNGLGRCLRIPRSIRSKIREDSDCKTDEERKAAVLRDFLDHHPAPGWREVSWALYMMSGKNYINSDTVKSHESLRKLYEGNIVEAPATEDQRLLDSFHSAIESNGSLLQTVMQATLHGNAGSGKTSLIRTLQGKEANPKETSTGVMEEPARIEITQSTVLIEGSMCWTPVTNLQEEAALLVREVNSDQVTLLAFSDGGMDDELAKHEAGLKHPYKIQSLNEVDQSMADHDYRPLFSEARRPTPDFEHRNLQLSEMITKAVQNANTVMKLLKDPWTLYISDIGGQLEFQELIPALTNGPSLHFLVIAAHLGLNKKCRVVYLRKNGESSVPYFSNYTLKENVLQQLATIMSTGKLGQPAKVMLFLTFKDQVKPEELLEIDRELREAVEATEAFESGAIEFAEENLLCHPIDNLKPSEEDIQRIRKTVERIGNRDNAYRIRTPYTWLYFGIALRGMKAKVLSYDTSVQIGKQCGIETKQNVNDALKFLHYNVGVVRHFNEVSELQDVVIKEPQLLFDNVTELVVNTFTFDQVDRSTLKDFRNKGIFSTDMVHKLSTGSTLLTNDKLIAFLKHHHIIAPLEADEALKGYFLPCSLVHADVQVAESTPLPQFLPSLFFTFDTGYTPRGVFGFLVADLLNSSKELGMSLKEDKIYRDQVSLAVQPYLDNFRLTGNPMYIRVDVIPSSFANRKVTLGKICCAVRKRICHGLKTVTRKLNYTEKSSHNVCFQCQACTRDHPAEINFYEEEVCSMTCKLRDQSMEVPQGFDIWFNEKAQYRKRNMESQSVSVPKPKRHTATAEDLSVRLHAHHLKHIQSATWDARAMWRDVGLGLDVDKPSLDAIELKHRGNPDECFTDVLTTWLLQDSPPPTLQILAEALQSPPVGFQYDPNLAESLKNMK